MFHPSPPTLSLGRIWGVVGSKNGARATGWQTGGMMPHTYLSTNQVRLSRHPHHPHLSVHASNLVFLNIPQHRSSPCMTRQTSRPHTPAVFHETILDVVLGLPRKALMSRAVSVMMYCPFGVGAEHFGGTSYVPRPSSNWRYSTGSTEGKKAIVAPDELDIGKGSYKEYIFCQSLAFGA